MKSSTSSSGLAGADSELLRAFATGRDEAAFRALTERYAGLVYGIAFRRLMNAGAAQEVTSEVFTMLAWKAPRLTQTGCLAAWLQRSAVLITANAVRRETRRRLAMNAYTSALEPALSPPPLEDPAWHEALEHLDESLARLPDRDRQLLLARYFTGRTYGEIAVETAAGEEAVKKAGQRALQKLRALLLRRGVTLSAAVLASGLTHHVQAGTPEGVAFQAASTALRAAPLPGLFQIVQHSLTYMFYGKTLTAAAAALLLCAALGGGSFLTARQLAMAFSGSPPGSTAIATVPATPAAGSPTDKPASRSVTAIMREAVELLRRSGKESSPEMDRAILLLAGFSPEEMREAAKAAEIYRENRQLAGALATALGAAWAEQDPAAALEWLEVYPEPAEWPATGGADHIAAAWFERDGRAAWDWWRRRRQSSPPPLMAWDSIIGDGMGNWARKNPAAATAALGEIDVSPRLLRGFAEHLRQMAIDADSPAVEAALKWRDPSLRVELAVLLAGGLDPFGKGTEELDRVFPLLNRLCADQPGAMETAAAPLMERWVSETPEKAVDWILNETAPTSAGTRQLMEPALRAWGKKSPSEAWQWMENRIAADPVQADRFYGALLDSQEAGKPNDGTLVDRWLSGSWAAQITSASPQSRDAFLHYWAGQWLTFAAQEGLPVEKALTRWRGTITEAGGDSASGRLAMQALQIAEQAAADTAPALNSTSAHKGGSILSTESTIQQR